MPTIGISSAFLHIWLFWLFFDYVPRPCDSVITFLHSFYYSMIKLQNSFGANYTRSIRYIHPSPSSLAMSSAWLARQFINANINHIVLRLCRGHEQVPHDVAFEFMTIMRLSMKPVFDCIGKFLVPTTTSMYRTPELDHPWFDHFQQRIIEKLLYSCTPNPDLPVPIEDEEATARAFLLITWLRATI